MRRLQGLTDCRAQATLRGVGRPDDIECGAMGATSVKV
jgi:hypothetical protein